MAVLGYRVLITTVKTLNLILRSQCSLTFQKGRHIRIFGSENTLDDFLEVYLLESLLWTMAGHYMGFSNEYYGESETEEHRTWRHMGHIWGKRPRGDI